KVSISPTLTAAAGEAVVAASASTAACSVGRIGSSWHPREARGESTRLALAQYAARRRHGEQEQVLERSSRIRERVPLSHPVRVRGQRLRKGITDTRAGARPCIAHRGSRSFPG